MEKANALSKPNSKIFLCEVKKIFAKEKEYFDKIQSKLAEIPKDFGETLMHSQRVANFGYLLAKKFGWSEKRTGLFAEICISHDIGKITLPKEVLHLEEFGPEEWAIITRHSRAGYLFVLRRGRGPRVAIPILLHHEFQGKKSYPKITASERLGFLKEDKYHARLLSMCDVLDAYAFGRPLTKIMPIPLSLARKKMGDQFKKTGEEEIIEFLFAQYPKIKKIADAACPL